MIQLLSFATIAGLFGGNGIGNLLVQKGLDGFSMGYVTASSIVLISATIMIQWFGKLLAAKMQHGV